MAVLTIEENFLTIVSNEQLSTEVHLNLPYCYRTSRPFAVVLF